MRRKASRIGKMIAGLAVVAMMTSAASAEVITLFSDDFNRGSTTYINGTSPSYVNLAYYPGGLTWQAGDGVDWWNTTTAGQPFAGGAGVAVLAFTPQVGNIYKMTWVAKANADHMAFGFGDLTGVPSNNDYEHWGQNGLMSPSNYMGLSSTAGNGTWASGSFTFTPSGTGYETLSWVLDMTVATPTATLSVNGETIGTVDAVSTINAVGTGRNGGYNYNLESVSLQIIPEPASGLMLLGAMGAIAFIRRKLHG